jgi:hypothetical protein
MDAFRKTMNTLGSEIPSALTSAWDSVQVESNKLGPMEEDYLQAEEVLSGQEWTFMEMEEDFYHPDETAELFSDLVPDQFEDSAQSDYKLAQSQQEASTPLDKNEYQAAVTKYDILTSEFDSLRLPLVEFAENLSERRDSDLPYLQRWCQPWEAPAVFEIYSDLLDRIIATELKVRRLRNTPSPSLAIELPTFAARRQTFPSAPADEFLPENLDGDRMNDWLLDVLDNSVLERRQFCDVLDSLFISTSELHSTQNWLSIKTIIRDDFHWDATYNTPISSMACESNQGSPSTEKPGKEELNDRPRTVERITESTPGHLLLPSFELTDVDNDAEKSIDVNTLLAESCPTTANFTGPHVEAMEPDLRASEVSVNTLLVPAPSRYDSAQESDTEDSASPTRRTSLAASVEPGIVNARDVLSHQPTLEMQRSISKRFLVLPGSYCKISWAVEKCSATVEVASKQSNLSSSVSDTS